MLCHTLCKSDDALRSFHLSLMWRRVSRHKLAGRHIPGRIRGLMHIWFLLLVFVTPCFTGLGNISSGDVAAPVLARCMNDIVHLSI